MFEQFVNRIPYYAIVALIGIGMYACIFRKNLIKIIIGITVVESGVNFFLVALGYRRNAVAPIYTSAPLSGEFSPTQMVLPIPQALTLTSIVIGVAVLALMLSLSVQIYKKQGTLDSRKGVLKK
jgi:multicomponent Na+:H+ antiporter subunit C